MKSSGIGGQAVLEGVMMKNRDRYAVAVRKPNGGLAVEKGKCTSLKDKNRFFGLPIVRGVVGFVESLVLGTQMLTSSAAYFEEEEEPGKFERWLIQKFGKKADKIIMGAAVLLGILLAFGLFTLLPLAVITLIPDDVMSYEYKALVEGGLRLLIFLIYIALISANRDMKRVFMYHGAEHKAINCIEHGLPLNVKNVRKSSRQHKRCGTSFLLFVILISIIFFIFVRVETFWLRLLVRVLFVPLLAGISYELIRLAGSSDSKVMDILSKPGLWLQGLTTREPNDEMIKVAIASVEAVFDWEAYQKENFPGRKYEEKVKRAAERRNDKRAENGKANSENEKKESVGVASNNYLPKQAFDDTIVEKKMKAAVEPEKKGKTEPVEDLAAKFDIAFEKAEEKKPEVPAVTETTSVEKGDTTKAITCESVPEKTEEELAKESRSRLVAKVSAADRSEEAGKLARREYAAAAEDDEEEDDILKALDQYFVFDGEKTVMERSDNK